MPPPDGELQDDSPGAEADFISDRAIRVIVWVVLLATAALIGFVIHATVHLGGPSCFGKVAGFCRS